MSVIFISHSSSDNAITGEIALRLEREGYEALFLDFDPRDGIAAGNRWETEIFRNLKRSRALLIVCTAASMASRWCFAEVVMAKTRGCEVFPVKAEPCDLFPNLEPFQAIDLYEGEVAYTRLFDGLRRAGLDPRSSHRFDVTRSPFPGLMPFSEVDAAAFFGREHEIDSLCSVLNQMARNLEVARFAVVTGASGVGKSSLLRAGIVPQLKKQAGQWIVAPMFRPRGRPISELCAALDALLAGGPLRDRWNIVANKLQSSSSPTETVSQELATLLRDHLVRSGRPDAAIVLAVDQLEESFDRPGSSHDARRFFEILHHLLSDPSGSAVVVSTIRLSSLKQFQDAAANAGLEHTAVLLKPLSTRHFGRIIFQCADLIPIDIEPHLVDQMVRDATQDDALPLLAFTLERMYRIAGKPGSRWDSQLYEQVGGIAGSILASTNSLELEDEPLLQRWLVRLFRMDTADQWRRQPLRRSEIPESVMPSIRVLINERLLVETEDEIEVAHESLSRVWPTLGTWLDADREFQLARLRLESSRDDWIANGRNVDLLLRGVALSRATEWAEMRREDLAPSSDFIDASIAEANRAREHDRRLERERRTVQQQSLAQGLTLAARRAAAEHPQRALLLAAEAALATREHRWDPQVEQVFRDALDGCSGYGLAGHRDALTCIAISDDGRWVVTGSYDETARLWDMTTTEPSATAIVVEHADSVSAVAIRRDGRQVASADREGTILLWDLDPDGALVGTRALKSHREEINQLRFSPDNRWLASCGEGAQPRVWTTDFEAGDSPFVFEGHKTFRSSSSVDEHHSYPSMRSFDTPDVHGAFGRFGGAGGYGLDVEALAWSPDGQYLATGGDDGQVLLWKMDVPASTPEKVFASKDKVSALAIGPDDTLFVGTSELVGAGRIVELAPDDRREVATRDLGPTKVNAVSVSANGKWLAAGTGDTLLEKPEGDALYFWNVTSDPRQEVARIGSTDGPVIGLGFWDAEAMLVTAHEHGSVRQFDLARSSSPRPSRTLRAHEAKISACAWSPDRGAIATASHDRTARYFPLASAGVDGQSRITLRGHSDKVKFVAFTPDSRRLVSSAAADRYREPDVTPRVWSIADPTTVGVERIEGHRERITSTAVSPDGRWAASGDDAGVVNVWSLDRQTSGKPTILSSARGVDWLRFDALGRWLIAGCTGGTFRESHLHIWSMRDGMPREPLVAIPKNAPCYLDAGASLLITKNAEGALETWDLSGDELSPAAVRTPPRGLHGPFAMSPDRQWLAGRADDGTIRMLAIRHSVLEPEWRTFKRASSEKPDINVGFSPDGRWLYVIPDRDAGPPQLWRVDDPTGEPISLNGHKFPAVFDDERATSRWLITAARDGAAMLWDLQSNDPSKNPIVLRHTDWVMRLAVSRDGRRLASGDRAGHVRLWSLDDDNPAGTEVLARAASNEVTSLTFSPDDRWLAAGDSAGIIDLIPMALDDLLVLARRAVGRNLGAREWELAFGTDPYRETFPGLPVPADM